MNLKKRIKNWEVKQKRIQVERREYSNSKTNNIRETSNNERRNKETY